MRIVCPACAAAYEVPVERLVPGRAVRCARCGTDWTPLAAEPERAPAAPELQPEPLPPPPEPEPATAIPIAASSEAPSRAAGPVSALGVAWAVSILVLLAAAWGAYAERGAVMHAWPPSIRAYAALGLDGSR